MKSKYLILVIGFIVALIATVGYIMFKDEELSFESFINLSEEIFFLFWEK